MRILHIANFSIFKNESVFYSMDRKISNGLIRNGHFVSDLSYRDIAKHKAIFKMKKLGVKKLYQSVLSTIKNLEPELILLGHTELIDDLLLQEIKTKYPKIKIAMWWVDWLKNLDSIQSKIAYLDVLFTTTGIKAIDKRLFKNNVTIAYLPNMCDASIESYKAFERTIFEHDLFFAGRVDEQRKLFLEQLKTLIPNKLRFDLFGNTKESLLFGNEFLKTIGKSKMALNISRDNESSLYTSDRIIQLIANGTLVISQRIPDFEKLFTKNEIIYFDTLEECAQKVNFYSKQEEKRVSIAMNGWKKAHSAFNSTRVTQFMLETIFEIPFSQEYEWKDEIQKGNIQ